MAKPLPKMVDKKIQTLGYLKMFFRKPYASGTPIITAAMIVKAKLIIAEYFKISITSGGINPISRQ